MTIDDESNDEESTGNGPNDEKSIGNGPKDEESTEDDPNDEEPTGDERSDDETNDVESVDDPIDGQSNGFESVEYPIGDGPADVGSEQDTERGWLSTLLSALDRLERESVVSFSTLDYDVAIQTGLDDLESPTRRAGRRVDRRPSSPEESRTRRVRRKRDPPAVTTRTYEDELIVTADVSGRNPDDVTVGYDDDELVLGLGGTELERVELPWTERTSTAFIQNGILTVRITPKTDDESAPEQ